MKLYQKVAQLIARKNNSYFLVNKEYEAEKIEDLIKENFPHGSGFDGRTWLDLDKSRPEKLVIFTEFHHMNENGYYDGWSTLKIVVTPSFRYGFDFKLTGIAHKYRFDMGYFEETINHFLETEIK